MLRGTDAYSCLNAQWIITQLVKSSVVIAAQSTVDPFEGTLSHAGVMAYAGTLWTESYWKQCIKIRCIVLFCFFLGHIRFLIWFAVRPRNWRGTNLERQAGTRKRKWWKGNRSGCRGSCWLWIVKLYLWGLLFWSLLLHLLLGENFQGNLHLTQILAANCTYIITDSVFW